MFKLSYLLKIWSGDFDLDLDLLTKALNFDCRFSNEVGARGLGVCLPLGAVLLLDC